METKKMVFFHEGDVVQLKQDLPNKPLMVVKEVVKATTKNNKKYFAGVRCFWFTIDGMYQSQIFNTKDLEKIEG